MRPTDLLYDGAARAARILSPLLERRGGKLARTLRGRDLAGPLLERWAAERRDPERPLLWLHAPSVGEGLQARAVLDAVRERLPTLQVVYTHTSPSAEDLAGGAWNDVGAYLPWDHAPASRELLERLRPSLLCFTKTEVWPGLVRAAAGAGVPSALVAATLPEGAGRLRPGSRALLGPTFSRLDILAAISAEDGGRFRRLGVAEERVQVTGDPGIDSAARRASSADRDAAHLSPFRRDPRPTVVAGSTWPADEAVLMPAASRLRESVPGLRLVLAPHEPTPAHVTSLEQSLREDGWRVARLGRVEEEGTIGESDAVVVDRVGVLASLYTVGTCAYVGGGFGTDGLHSVLEPAAAGIPVAFGPRHGNARAAGELLDEGAARTVEDSADLEGTLLGWLGDPESAGADGRRALDYIRRHRGAARRTADLLARLVHPSPTSGGETGDGRTEE